MSETTERKAYPTIDERIAKAQAKIEQLESLNNKRGDLIEKTEKVLAERKEAFIKSSTALKKEKDKLEKLINLKENPPVAPKGRARSSKSELLRIFEQSGKSIEDIKALLGIEE